MTIQPITQNPVAFAEPYNQQLFNTSLQEKPFRGLGHKGANAQATFSTTYYSSDSLILNYTNNDGDSVTLSMEHVEYQKAMLSIAGNADSEQWKEVVEKIKEEFLSLKQAIIQRFIESLGGEKVDETEESEYKKIEGLPEYWNAENTSQRIVDFATSFYGLTESSGKEYFEIMINAVKEGFNQAMDALGELPDAVNDLAHRTYELTLEKLEAWAVEMGIQIEDENCATA